VQIGPVIRGTVLRDSLDFVSFNAFTNQTDFAQFGKAFNVHVDRNALSKLPREGLVGRSVTVVGAFPPPKANELPLVTPALITLGPTP
jgi:predicted lipoprotein